MPTLHTSGLALPYPSAGTDPVSNGDDILRELVNRLEVVVGPPKGSAGGDLGGTYPNPTVVTINGVAVSAVVFNTDARLTNARVPSGAAGGDLGGTYPNPAVAQVNGRAASAVVFTDDPRLSGGLADGAVTFAKLASTVLAGFVPIGAIFPYVGDSDPGDIGGGVTFLLADGRLISRTTYAAFYGKSGHKYNGGADPGSSQVRIPDKRGRVSIGEDNMGTAQGAANRIPNSNRVHGQNGGEERHTLSVAELATHKHELVDSVGTFAFVSYVAGGVGGATASAPPTGYNNGSLSVGFAGSSTPHNNMSPYEVDNYIVRIA